MMLILFGISFVTLFISAFVLINNFITHKNLSINQKEWDEYSKGMTNKEKLDCFHGWLIRQKVKHNWRYLYIPDIGLEVKE